MQGLTSLSFAVFFTGVFAVYHLTRQPVRWLVLLVASVVFILAFGSVIGLALVAVTVATGFASGVALERYTSPAPRRLALGTALGVVAGLFVALRYSAPVIDSPGALPNSVSELTSPPSLVAFGFSFYALKTIGYLLDVYYRRIPAERHVGRFATYVGLFLELPAGPIDRAERLLPELKHPPAFEYGKARRGCQRVLWGLFKKVVIADRLAVFVALAYRDPEHCAGLTLLMATIAFAFQLYCDFSAYSDIVIGLGQLLGLQLPENFKRPYFARSVSEFWQRWHISLSSWLRDYLFLPIAYQLGRWGDRLGLPEPIQYWMPAASIVATMLIGGAWHGNKATFLAWGGLLAMFMVVSLATRRARARLVRYVGLSRAPRVRTGAQILQCFIGVSLAFVFFRAASVRDGLIIIERMGAACWRLLYGELGGTLASLFLTYRRNLAIAAAGLCIVVVVDTLEEQGVPVAEAFDRLPRSVRWLTYEVAVVVIGALGVWSGEQFVYAGF